VRSALTGSGPTAPQTMQSDIHSMHKKHTDELTVVKEQLCQLANDTKQQLSELFDVCSKQRRSGDMLDDSAAESSDSLFEHRHQRACVAADERPVLARDELLDTVFSFVGIDDYYYVAGVCRNWRGRYMTFCHSKNTAAVVRPRRYHTVQRNTIVSRSRLQLALDDGVTVDELDMTNRNLVVSVLTESLEPVEVYCCSV
jgi:hypothetical protein